MFFEPVDREIQPLFRFDARLQLARVLAQRSVSFDRCTKEMERGLRCEFAVREELFTGHDVWAVCVGSPAPHPVVEQHETVARVDLPQAECFTAVARSVLQNGIRSDFTVARTVLDVRPVMALKERHCRYENRRFRLVFVCFPQRRLARVQRHINDVLRDRGEIRIRMRLHDRGRWRPRLHRLKDIICQLFVVCVFEWGDFLRELLDDHVLDGRCRAHGSFQRGRREKREENERRCEEKGSHDRATLPGGSRWRKGNSARSTHSAIRPRDHSAIQRSDDRSRKTDPSRRHPNRDHSWHTS